MKKLILSLVFTVSAIFLFSVLPGNACQTVLGQKVCYKTYAWCCDGSLVIRCDYGGGSCTASSQSHCPICPGKPQA